MIREAELKDRERIEELYQILLPDERDIHVLDERIEQIRKDSNHFLFVYEAAGRVEGTVLLSFCLDSMYGNRPYAVVENLIVDPSSHGKGIGKEMLAHIERRCREADCREILLMSNVRRSEAHAFFEHQGFNHVAKGFKKYLGS